MKKRVWLIVLGAFLLCLALGLCLYALAPDPIYARFKEKEATLIVQGQELDADGAYVYDGFEFRYPDTTLIPIPLVYPTSYAKLPMIDDTWVHAVVGHCVRVKERAGQELIVDDTSMDEVLFYFFGNQSPTFTLYDWENATITVTVHGKTE